MPQNKSFRRSLIVPVPMVNRSKYIVILLLAASCIIIQAGGGATRIIAYDIRVEPDVLDPIGDIRAHGQLSSTGLAGSPEETMRIETVNALSLTVSYYELYFEVDPDNEHFSSIQNITFITSSSTPLIIFYLLSSLVVTEIILWDNATNEVLLGTWEMDYDDLVEGQAGMYLAQISMNIAGSITPLTEYRMHLEYSMKSEAIADSVGEELLQTTVSKQATRGLGWPSGLIPIFVNTNDYAAPHSLEIKHPKNQQCIATGARISTVAEGEYVIVKNQATHSTAPSFSIATYQTLKLTQNNITVEFFYFEGEAISEEIVSTLIQGITLFTEYLGDTGDNYYQFGFVDVEDSVTGGTSRGDTIFMRTGRYRNLATDMIDKVLMVTFLFHEIAHNWNGFVQGVTWTGNDYFLWYQEGGANFLSSWACEKTMGVEAAVIFRKFNLERYDQFRGYDSQYQLKTIPYIFFTELSDIAIAYEYAGMVWEQFLLKVGEEAVFNGLANFTKRYWINSSWHGMVTIDDLFEAIEKYTPIDVESYLDQWGMHNPMIELSMAKPHTEQVESGYQTTIELNVEADWDYEIFTSIGYKTEEGMGSIAVNLTQRGTHIIQFTSDQIPKSITVDPEYRVPQTGVTLRPDEPSDLGIIILMCGAVVVGILVIRKYK